MFCIAQGKLIATVKKIVLVTSSLYTTDGVLNTSVCLRYYMNYSTVLIKLIILTLLLIARGQLLKAGLVLILG